MQSDDETAITEITLSADGRIFVFGLSREVVAVLRELCPSDHPLLDIPVEPAIAEDVPE